MAKIGRPISWPIPKTPLSNRLQCILPHEGLAKIAQNYFGGISKETVSRYLSGDSEPTISQILGLCEAGQINPLYVIFGVGHYSDEVYGLDNPDLRNGEPKGGICITEYTVPDTNAPRPRNPSSGEEDAPFGANENQRDPRLPELLAISMELQEEISKLQRRVLNGEIPVEQFGEVIGEAATAAGGAMDRYDIKRSASKSG